MTEEQEQIVLKMLCKLAETNVVWVQYYGDWMVECLFCDGSPSSTKEFFKHYPDCPILLAVQLRATV